MDQIFLNSYNEKQKVKLESNLNQFHNAVRLYIYYSNKKYTIV